MLVFAQFFTKKIENIVVSIYFYFIKNKFYCVLTIFSRFFLHTLFDRINRRETTDVYCAYIDGPT